MKKKKSTEPGEEVRTSRRKSSSESTNPLLQELPPLLLLQLFPQKRLLHAAISIARMSSMGLSEVDGSDDGEELEEVGFEEEKKMRK